jgi:hypothetical protein
MSAGIERERRDSRDLMLQQSRSGPLFDLVDCGKKFKNWEPTSPPDTLLPLISANSFTVDLSHVTVKSQYDIKLTTAGAIFLVFQALYPYLLIWWTAERSSRTGSQPRLPILCYR